MNQNTSMNRNKSVNQNEPAAASFWNAHGKIPYGMTNDYMFRAVLQSNNKVLRSLIGALLHLEENEIRSAEITNTIILGESIQDKEIRLDINVILNDDTFLNLEMQVANELNWPNRSVLYLCRSFDQLNHGQGYSEIKPVIHIGFLDYTLFKERPEFYATYKLINVNNHNIYSDKMTLSVVDLSRIDLATDVDKAYHIDQWAALFKATTWEGLKMIAANSEYLTEASQTIFQMSADERIRKICQDREEYYQDIRCYQKIIAEQENVIAKQENVIAKQEDALAKQEDALAKQEDALAEQEDALAKQENVIAEQKDALAKQEAVIEQLQAKLASLNKTSLG